MKKMDHVNSALVNCCLSDLPEKPDHQEDDASNMPDTKNGFEDLIIRERANY